MKHDEGVLKMEGFLLMAMPTSELILSLFSSSSLSLEASESYSTQYTYGLSYSS
jgi:hypothetical protein